jgi:dehydrogenase/reductase SDR family protein 7B
MRYKSRFRDKVVWITGASSGIGEALAYRFNTMGARLILSSNEDDELLRVKKNCAGQDSDTIVLPLDLSVTDTLESKAKEALDRFGHVDILVNNGGISVRAPAKDTKLEVDRKIMEIDYFGHVALTKAVLPSMLERKTGYIVVTTSIAGIISVPLRSAYCAAKHALHGFFETLRAEVWRDNIKVTLICPAAVRTKISLNALTESGGKFGKMDRVIEQGISPEECAEQIIKAIVKEKKEVVLGKGLPKWGVYIKRYLPSLYYRILQNAKVET